MVPGLQRYAMDSYISDVTNPSHTTIIFTLSEEPGALAETLRIFKVRRCLGRVLFSSIFYGFQRLQFQILDPH